jgi:hypothetical protein
VGEGAEQDAADFRLGGDIGFRDKVARGLLTSGNPVLPIEQNAAARAGGLFAGVEVGIHGVG